MMPLTEGAMTLLNTADANVSAAVELFDAEVRRASVDDIATVVARIETAWRRVDALHQWAVKWETELQRRKDAVDSALVMFPLSESRVGGFLKT